MNTTMDEIRMATGAPTPRWLRRASCAAAVVAIVAAAIGLSVIAPESTFGSGSMVAIARADCPPDCGGGPGNGGTPSGPPGGGTEFAPPSMSAMPSYEPGRGQPPLDQNNGISIYNSAAPQPSQAAQPSQQPVQNQDGSYNRAANGEQQPINYNNAPNNQQLNNDWQNLSNQLNNQSQGSGQQPEQNTTQTDQMQDKQDNDETCQSILMTVQRQFPDLFGQDPTDAPAASSEQVAEYSQYLKALEDATKKAGLQGVCNKPTPADCNLDDLLACFDPAWDRLSPPERAVCESHSVGCWDSRHDAGTADSESQKYFGKWLIDNKGDAARHCIWSALMTLNAGYDFAKEFADAHERGWPGEAPSTAMDLHNNDMGRLVGLVAESNGGAAAAISRCVALAREATLIEHPEEGLGLPRSEFWLVVLKDG
ncbi:DUF6973 domain-containing protein [Mycobacteroides salmoniphilum]|uniref:DUF6973 domain-containing protein n=1 Tax=Mycobacteroides salmoniphilum TaxID=404941 RepID=A0A4R8SWF7_9MYCO|nr:hypothetical protein [Mycobacteroides salmoniphilum]TEA06650.1 hypothetical protein CCUG60884_01788 [Mycobacteroides salmoniphilum]